MTYTRERSGIFKFFYVVLSVLTFPIFVLIYICKHPFWIMFFILLIGGGLAYYPMSKGVELSGVVEWYKNQYADKKLELVTKAVENGKATFIPDTVVKEVEKTKLKLEEDKKESLREKSENYNDKVVRDNEFDEVVSGVKKKGGFKKKSKPINSKESVETAIDEGAKAGGLDVFVKKVEEKNSLEETESKSIENEMLELDALIEELGEKEIAKEVTEPQVEDVVEPVAKEVTESQVEEVAEPVAEVVTEPQVEEVAEPVAEVVAEPQVEEVAEPVAKEVTESQVEEVVEPVAEVVAEPQVEEVVEPVAEVVAEPQVEDVVEPVAEVVAEPQVEEVIDSVDADIFDIEEVIEEEEEEESDNTAEAPVVKENSGCGCGK